MSIYNTSRSPMRGRGRGNAVPRPAHTPARTAPPLRQQLPEQPKPQIPFNEFQLKSSARQGKNHLMNFETSKTVEMKNFTRPVKLQRKDAQQRLFHTPDEASDLDGSSALAPALHGPKTGADTSLIAPMGGATRNKNMLFKKRTKQIYLAKEDTRELKAQEDKPWILEDYDGQHSFTGTLEGGQTSDYVFLVLTDNGFKAVPVDRWYKFRPKRNIKTLQLEEAEAQLKNKNEPARWSMLNREKSASAEEERSSRSHKLKIVENAEPKRGDDDDEQRNRQDSDVDDLDFDDVFEDDEEGGVEHEAEDEEAKDSKERVKKEIKGYIAGDSFHDDNQDENGNKLTSEGKQMKKLVRNLEKNRAYDSDDEADPYASSTEEIGSDLDDDEEKSDAESAQKKPALPLKKKGPQVMVKKPSGKGKKESLSQPIRGRPMSPTKSLKREPSPVPFTAHRSSPNSSSQPTSPREAHVAKKPRPSGTSSSSSTETKRRHRPSSTEASSSSTGSPASDSFITEAEVINTLRGRNMATKELLKKVFKKRDKKDLKENLDVIRAILKKVARHGKTNAAGEATVELRPEFN